VRVLTVPIIGARYRRTQLLTTESLSPSAGEWILVGEVSGQRLIAERVGLNDWYVSRLISMCSWRDNLHDDHGIGKSW
jgi:hypothetical protein